MYRTAARVSSSSQEKTWSVNLTHKVAISNGYPAGDGATRQARHPSRRSNVVDSPEKIPFCLPYISDDMSRAVRGCLRKAGLENDVRVVEIPPANLKGQLVRNRAYDRLCTTPNCVVCQYGREGPPQLFTASYWRGSDTGRRTAIHSGGSSSGKVSQAEKEFDTSDIPTSRNRKPS
ncbi:hypothetical protein RB195_019622 [Necator americanus]|uniref:Uncharacterized protein n=1 Tax=Necator americanus TaxID=51031 RepID=A0ABR1CIK5_NECAM